VSRRQPKPTTPPPVPTIRCAIYTRKSSEEGLQQEFNSLDAQREAAEAYIASQKAEGWVCLPERYDDGGFTGGNMERPALKRLLADIDAGHVDCVVVYKVDRLSRSLLDFARIMETFERQNISFVSVTQHFNTTNSMGRLTLNILLSFAQFEREIIGERIRDKIAASRARGKWTGGTPILGYDVDRTNGGPKLVVNAVEASRVREIFELYLELGSLLQVVADLDRRGWVNKVWTTRDGRKRGGLPFDKCRLHQLLTNPLYVGKVKHKTELFAGEHEAIVPDDVFDDVQKQLQRNGRSATTPHRNRHGALLRGLLYCKACGRAMSHTFSCKGAKRYRYYACTHAVKSGRSACPSRSLPAAEIEAAVIDQIRCIGEDPGLLDATLGEARRQTEAAIERLEAERRTLERGLSRCHAEILRLAASEATEAAVARTADLEDQIRQTEHRLSEVATQTAARKQDLLNEADVATAFADFDNVWTSLTPREQVRLINLLVSRVEYDAADNSIEIAFHPTDIKALDEGRGAVGADIEEAA